MAGLYIHVPFCAKRCLYCDFFSNTEMKYKEPYVTALIRELEIRKDYIGNEPLETIYFGGGTPSQVRLLYRSCQAEKAYRELDARFVKMTGRRPYADELFASLRQRKEKTPEAKRPKQVHKPILRNSPSKGRKMGL